MDTRVFTIFFYPLLFSNDKEIYELNGYTPEEWKQIESTYDRDEYNAIVGSLLWARKNPNFDYRSTLTDVKMTNKALYSYLIKLADSYNVYKNLA